MESFWTAIDTVMLAGITNYFSLSSLRYDNVYLSAYSTGAAFNLIIYCCLFNELVMAYVKEFKLDFYFLSIDVFSSSPSRSSHFLVLN